MAAEQTFRVKDHARFTVGFNMIDHGTVDAHLMGQGHCTPIV
jgi:hypothetical protein